MLLVFFIGDITLVPDVSVELVVNAIEGYNYSLTLSLHERRTCLDVVFS